MTRSPYTLPDPELNWRDDQPVAGRFGDRYFSSTDGLAESRHVFLAGNDLASRWRHLPAGGGLFVIGETGFGTGLNCLAAWRLWQQSAPPDWRLLYISVEGFALSAPQIERALQPWPELAPLRRRLLELYPPALPGQHRLALAPGAVDALLLWGEAGAALKQLVAGNRAGSAGFSGVDAWFLDGFAPALNPGLWQPDIQESIRTLSAPGATFATFTAAGDVRRGLAAQGFEVRKVRGFGRKRDMLRGQLVEATQPSPAAAAIAAWSCPPAPPRAASVAVIGGGLAGTTTARALAERGLHVTLLERRAQLAAETSGNSRGLLYTKLSPKPGPLNWFTLHGLLHARRFYTDLLSRSPQAGRLDGLLQLPVDAEDAGRQAAVAAAFAAHPQLVEPLDHECASARAGFALSSGGLWLHAGGWLCPPAVCNEQVEHAGIELRLNTTVEQLSRQKGHWILRLGGGRQLECDAVVLANAGAARAFQQCESLPLRPMRGQISTLEMSALAHLPQCPICHSGYLVPTPGGGIAFGATFSPDEDDAALREADHRENVARLAQALPGLLRDRAPAVHGGRAGVRWTAPDYLPVVGPAPDRRALRRDYAALRHNARTPIDAPGSYHLGLYLNLAHGSRGLLSAPLAAELTAALITGEPLPLTADLIEALNPARFIIRELRRGG